MAAAHTFLKKNPTDPYLTKNMNYYKTLLDVEDHLIDHEEQPYEVRDTGSAILLLRVSGSHINPISSAERFPEERDALQQRRLQRQRPKHGAGHQAVL